MSEDSNHVEPSLGELWDEYMAQSADSSDQSQSVLYGLPRPLVSAIAEETSEFFDSEAYSFECRLSRVLEPYRSIGLDRACLIHCPLFEAQSTAPISKELFESLNWSHVGIEFESLNAELEETDSNAGQIRRQLNAYIGWLITNPSFIREVEQFREQVSDGQLQYTSEDELIAQTRLTKFQEFCARWQIDGFYCWDLPCPPSTNFGGPELPKWMQSCAEPVTLQIPSVVRLPSRFPVEKLVKQAADSLTGSHLTEWQRIVNRSTRKLGVRRFADILHVHFFRNIALASRYSSRFHGNVEALDRAFGKFLGGRSAECVKELRLEIERRLKQT